LFIVIEKSKTLKYNIFAIKSMDCKNQFYGVKKISSLIFFYDCEKKPIRFFHFSTVLDVLAQVLDVLAQVLGG
jgi:hypothetical protein